MLTRAERADLRRFLRWNSKLVREKKYQYDCELAVYLDRPLPAFPSGHRPHIPLAIRREVFERDGYSCVECGSSVELSLDHVKHYSAGGEDTVENLRAACMPCNRRRGNRW